MGSQPIKIQCGKILPEILREMFAGKSCGKCLWEMFFGKSCGENLAGKGGGEKANSRKAVIGGNLAFGIG